MTVPEPVAAAARSMADRALSWLHANRALGALPPGTTEELADPDSVYKPLGETTLAASLLLRDGVAGPGQLAAAQSLMDFTWDQFRQGDMLYERQLRHTLMTDPLEVYAPFVRCGYRHADLDRLLAHRARLRSVDGVELLPNRRLAAANAARVVGLDREPGGGPDWDALARATWLGARPEPWAINWITAYAMTHTVFHLTDWGRLPHGMPPDLTAYVRTWLPVWIDIWREVQQWDLVVELLIVGASLDEPYCRPEDWEAVAALQHEDGLVPRDGDPVDDDPRERFTDHQHTVVVTAVAGSVALARAAGR
ncbi:DUF6895 family protein [Streptomyces albireticuli]|uniref:DUF6895 domain-containing protein n=1 Tax=Streptomyces albireticuli TaxID=1940 RepID=A0A2A2DGH6_9ACTN|nr:hypothetical protein [Streptomyces albireticuli]MCD9145223.1 hypothetical protein [Streptomyces albireticuli]MCD9164602.1 hypothetical protein [Streptomyces albireticuli]MCD9194867.1 hypothetical protein [Streptomyces albireticuli]PAU50509.1 hypothetical protein CK936_02335 [Streptomyces albireticuli]